MAKAKNEIYFWNCYVTKFSELSDEGMSLSDNYDPQEAIIRDKKLKLYDRILEAGLDCLTQHQKTIIIKYAVQDKTQTEIAEEMGIVDTAVYKSIFGNTTYKDGKKVAHYGGSAKKLLQWVQTDDTCQAIIKELSDLDSW